MSESFIHLNIHTDYSVVDGIVRIEQLMQRLVSYKTPAVAITDHMNLYAAIKFYNAAINNGIKPIIGCEINLSDESAPEKIYRLTLLCQNHKGYLNLLRIISNAYLKNNVLDTHTVFREDLESHSEGLIVLSGADRGDIGVALLNKNKSLADELLKRWKHNFGDRYYLEVQRINKPNEEKYISSVVILAQDTNTPLIATNNVMFLDEDSYEVHEARICIQGGELLTDQKRKSKYTSSQYLKKEDEMVELFADLPQALENSKSIAKRCSLILQLNQIALPAFPIPKGFTIETYLKEKSEYGLKNRFDNKSIDTRHHDNNVISNYELRLKKELSVINDMGYPGYFLIVYDFIQWAREKSSYE